MPYIQIFIKPTYVYKIPLSAYAIIKKLNSFLTPQFVPVQLLYFSSNCQRNSMSFIIWSSHTQICTLYVLVRNVFISIADDLTSTIRHQNRIQIQAFVLRMNFLSLSLSVFLSFFLSSCRIDLYCNSGYCHYMLYSTELTNIFPCPLSLLYSISQ